MSDVFPDKIYDRIIFILQLGRKKTLSMHCFNIVNIVYVNTRPKKLTDKLLLNLCRFWFQLLSGNTDTFTIVEQTLDPPPICSKVRILPYSDHVRTVCMRVELAGCTWKGQQKPDPINSIKRKFNKYQQLIELTGSPDRDAKLILVRY